MEICSGASSVGVWHWMEGYISITRHHQCYMCAHPAFLSSFVVADVVSAEHNKEHSLSSNRINVLAKLCVTRQIDHKIDHKHAVQNLFGPQWMHATMTLPGCYSQNMRELELSLMQCDSRTSFATLPSHCQHNILAGIHASFVRAAGYSRGLVKWKDGWSGLALLGDLNYWKASASFLQAMASSEGCTAIGDAAGRVTDTGVAGGCSASGEDGMESGKGERTGTVNSEGGGCTAGGGEHGGSGCTAGDDVATEDDNNLASGGAVTAGSNSGPLGLEHWKIGTSAIHACVALNT